MRKSGCTLLMVIVAVLAISLLAGYYIMGVKTQQQFTRLIALANNRSANVKMTTQSYARGWFSSKALLDVAVHRAATQQMPAQDYQFKLNVKIYHGPIIFAPHKFAVALGYARASMPLPQPTLEQFTKDFSIASAIPNVLATVLMHYNTSSVITLGIPAFKLSQKQGLGTLEWNGIMSYWHISADMRHIKGSIKFSGIKFTSVLAEGTVSPIKIAYNVVENIYGIWTGEASLKFPALDINAGGSKKLALAGFTMDTQSSITNGLLNTALHAALNKLVLNGKSYGPGTLAIASRNLDAKALSDIQLQLQSTDSSNLTHEQQQMMLMALLPKVSQLVSKGAKVTIQNISMLMPQGELKVTAQVSLPLANNTDVSNPLLLLTQLQANANLQIPVDLLQQTLSHAMENKIKQNQLLQQLVQKQLQQSQNSSASVMSANTAISTASNTSVPQNPTTALSAVEITKMADEQTQQELEHLVTTGVLIKKGNLYMLALIYQGGKLVVNGKPFDSSMIK